MVTGITGASIANYDVSSSGSTPGVLTVKPQWLSYDVTSGAFMPGIGMIGVPGQVKGLYTWPASKMTPLTGVTVARDAAGKELTDPSKLEVGRYTIRMESLTGPGASNYRLIQPEDSFRPY